MLLKKLLRFKLCFISTCTHTWHTLLWKIVKQTFVFNKQSTGAMFLKICTHRPTWAFISRRIISECTPLKLNTTVNQIFNMSCNMKMTETVEHYQNNYNALSFRRGWAVRTIYHFGGWICLMKMKMFQALSNMIKKKNKNRSTFLSKFSFTTLTKR